MLNFNNLNPLRKLSSSCDAILQKSKSKKSTNRAEIYVEKNLPLTPWKRGAFYKYRISQLKTIRQLCLNYATQKGVEILIIYRASIENPRSLTNIESVIKKQDLVQRVIVPLVYNIRLGKKQINGKELVDLMIDPLIYKIERKRILAETWPKVRLLFLAKKNLESIFEQNSIPQDISDIILSKMIALTQG